VWLEKAKMEGLDPDVLVTPPAFHDIKRHKEWWDKTVDGDKFFWEE
jgi:hypothetical protein